MRRLLSLPACLVAVAGILAIAGGAQAEPIIGLTTANSLVTFDSATPGTVSAPIAITGLAANEFVFDIDIRPANFALYGFTNLGRLYSINTTTGVATLSATLTGVSLDANTTRVGIDFNPTVDRLRIVSNTGQDLRLTPDTSLTTVDTPLNGAATSAVSAAYTNNSNTATTTVLHYIGPANGAPTLFNTSNPNGGVLTLVGPLGPPFFSNDVGFDISGVTQVAYASLLGAAGNATGFYTVNLTTGAATLVGQIGGGTTIRGIAARPVPEPAGLVLLGLGSAGLVLAARRRRALAP